VVADVAARRPAARRGARAPRRPGRGGGAGRAAGPRPGPAQPAAPTGRTPQAPVGERVVMLTRNQTCSAETRPLASSLVNQ